MKNLQKYLSILLFSALLLLLSVLFMQAANTPLPQFHVQSPLTAEIEEISIFDAEDGNYYVFLPSYTNTEHVVVSPPRGHEFSVGGIILQEGTRCSTFELETPYDFIINKKKTATLWFYQSANVATMYIDTATGNMDRIHEDKNYEENASIVLYTADGKIDSLDENAIMKGRGNSTWGSQKRPYSLCLSSESDLLNMGTATNWTLLSNAFDETNLNNKLILDLAARTGVQWTPESRWADVYLNGKYNGLYLLAEKVEVRNNRLDIDTNSGDFLCKIDIAARWKSLRNPFLTAAGRTVEISYPETLSPSEQSRIEACVNQLEQVILSGDDLSASAIFDLDSWIRRYLIDEISGNIDSDIASSYFYFSDGKFYAGPNWDYDLALGNNINNLDPCSFIAKKLMRSQTSYHRQLYANKSFYNRMVQIYQTEFVPVLRDLVNHEVASLSTSIQHASQLNMLRWQSMFETQRKQIKDAVHTPEALLDYLSQRIRFLDSVWLDNTEYCEIQFEIAPDKEYLNTVVKKGTCLKTPLIDLENSVWIDSITGEPVDFSQPITTDMILSKKVTEKKVTEKKASPLVTRDYITFLSIALLIIMFMGLLMVDIIQRHKERRAADEQKRTEVSP